MRKQIAVLLVIFAMFAFASAFTLEEQVAGGAHLQDRFSNPADWRANVKGAAYKVDEGVWGHRCLSQLQCDGLRKCSYWGWCQGSDYSGPQIQ